MLLSGKTGLLIIDRFFSDSLGPVPETSNKEQKKSTMTQNALMTLLLAAGKGTRMQSGLPKVLHEIAGRSLVSHVMAAAEEAGADRQVVVLGHGAEQVKEVIGATGTSAETYLQTEQLGTAHAVLASREALESFSGYIIILYGDTPLVTAPTIAKLTEALDHGADIAVLGFETANPYGYGRLIVDAAGQLTAIREEKDASEDEKKINFCNSGMYALKSEHILSLLDRVNNNNAKGEYYLTDIIEIGKNDGLFIKALKCDEEEVLGINDRVQLAEAERVMQNRMREEAMRNGATLQAPETVYFSYDTKIGRDVIIEPNVVFAPGVEIQDGAHIRGFSYFEQSIIRKGAVVGPYARMRPEADIGENAKIGNFVEVKKSVVEAGAKVNHLSYIGDARVGSGANIGAGTIICNYDGFLKHKTDIGQGAFIGSNSALVAPLNIGKGAYIGSGSVITEDVPADSLALTRSEQTGREGWAIKYRTRKEQEKAERKNNK